VNTTLTYTVFSGSKKLASGTRDEVLAALKPLFDKDNGAMFLIFEDQTGKQADFDLRGTLSEVLSRYKAEEERVGPGRPKLGVVAREVSLLPRHWEWLEEQPSGASAAIRRLVDEERKRNPDTQQAKLAAAAASRFLTAMAGNLPGYEEATRALYLRDLDGFNEQMRHWPKDIRSHAQHLAEGAFGV
jgi:hypothetical protein